MVTDSTERVTRRRYVAGAGLAVAVGLAGCSEDAEGEFEEDEPTDGGDETPEEDGESTPADVEEGELEVVHWWTAGGEQEALNALLEGFQEEYPDAEVVNNPAPGGAGSALDAVIQNRVLDENPPSTFQIWPGESLRPYTDADLLENIGDTIWDDEMRDAYLDGVAEAAAPAGDFVSVPINIHRLNNLFYNVDVVESADVDPTDIDDPQGLLDELEAIAQETDAVPLAHQTAHPWSTVQLWETIFVGQQGVDDFRTLIGGDVESLEDEVKEALELLNEYAEHYPEDAGSISWDQGNAQLINGEAAFIHQGDWAAGQYKTSDEFEYEENWNMVPFPGTDSVYSSVMDSFVFPTNNPSPDVTEKFLNYCGSVDAQERFNPIKGSIPPRTDVPDDEFGPFLTHQLEDFQNSTEQPPTIAHGSAVRPEAKSNIEEAFSGFIENGDVQAAYEGIRDAF